MYGVDWITPPNAPATSVAIPSAAMIRPVEYSSPAAEALSVQSMPADDGRQGQGDRHRQVTDRLGPGRGEPGRPRRPSEKAARNAARSTADSPRPRRPGPRGSSRNTAGSPRHGQHRPGDPAGQPPCAVSVARMTISDANPATGWPAMSSSGRKLISTRAIAASDPSSPARGTSRRTQPLNGRRRA